MIKSFIQALLDVLPLAVGFFRKIGEVQTFLQFIAPTMYARNAAVVNLGIELLGSVADMYYSEQMSQQKSEEEVVDADDGSEA